MIEIGEKELGSIMTLSNSNDFAVLMGILEGRAKEARKKNRDPNTGHREVDMNLGAEMLISEITEAMNKERLRDLKASHHRRAEIRECGTNING